MIEGDRINMEPTHRKLEVYFGDRPLCPVILSDLNSLSQQRGAINPAFDDIKLSILRDGLINNPDVAIMEPSDFEKYIKFVNRLWKADHKIGDYTVGDDGRYRLVVAGHTRIDAIRAICKDGEIDARNVDVYCKVYVGLSPEEILAIQMSENIHEKPAPERSAIALVETYYYGLENGAWSNKKEFLEANNGKFSRDALNKAIYFASLPVEVRDLVFAGAIKYSPVIELARVVEKYRDYILHKYFNKKQIDDLDETEKDSVAEDIRLWCCSEVVRIQNNRWSANTCKKRYQSYVSSWTGTTSSVESQGSLFSDPNEEWRRHQAEIRRNFAQSLRELSTRNAINLTEHMKLYLSVLGPDSPETETIYSEAKRAADNLRSSLGTIVLRTTEGS